MPDFMQAVIDPALPFLRYALIAGALASLAFGVMGTFVVARRISYIAGAVSHCVLGGIGAAMFFQHSFNIGWLHPMYGATFAAVLSAVVIGLVSLHSPQREDTVIGATWAIGMAVGLLFLARTPGYNDPMSYLFGNILLISKADLILVAALDIMVVAGGIYFYRNLLVVCFDEEFARLRGINVDVYFMALLVMTSLTVVLLVRVVGIVLVIALLTIPPAIAEYFTRKLWRIMILAAVFCLVFIIAGITTGYIWDLPPGPMIIVIAGAIYLIAAGVSAAVRKKIT